MDVEFSDKNVSAWGGMKIMKDLLPNIGIKEFMCRLDFQERVPTGVMNPCTSWNVFGQASWLVPIDSAIRLTCDSMKYFKKYLD